MLEGFSLALSGAAGLAIGAVFFGGLWWTIRMGMSAKQPALWFLGSLLSRMGIALTGFYLVSGGDWKRLLVCLLGFILARHAVNRMTRVTEPLRTATDARPGLSPEAGHAA